MSDSKKGDDIDELGAGVAIALATVCNQLIGRGSLDREALIADLARVVDDLRNNEQSVVTQMVVSGLAFALQEPANQQDANTTSLSRSVQIEPDALSEIDPHSPHDLIG